MKKLWSNKSALTKNIRRKHRLSQSSQGLMAQTRHVRGNSYSSGVYTQGNYLQRNQEYHKLRDETFKSGDFSKMRTEMEDLEFDDKKLFDGKKSHHRRKTSLIKTDPIHKIDLGKLELKSRMHVERNKAFNSIKEKIDTMGTDAM